MQQLPISDNIIPSEAFSSDWLLIITTIPILLYLVVIALDKHSAIWLSKLVYSNKYAANAFRNRSSGTQARNILLIITSFMGIATFTYFCEQIFSFNLFHLSGLILWLVNLGIITLAVALRFVTIRLTGEITRTGGAFEEYAFNIAQIYRFLAIPLLFINFLIPYLELVPDLVLVIIGLTLIANMLIIRVLRLFAIFIRRGFSLLYIILYLCALEFTPILVFAKYLSGAV